MTMIREAITILLAMLIGTWIGIIIQGGIMAKQNKVTFSSEDPAICKVEGGGKIWLLVDMTEEFKLPDEIEQVKEEVK